jgi:hypothetical protein
LLRLRQLRKNDFDQSGLSSFADDFVESFENLAHFLGGKIAQLSTQPLDAQGANLADFGLSILGPFAGISRQTLISHFLFSRNRKLGAFAREPRTL